MSTEHEEWQLDRQNQAAHRAAQHPHTNHKKPNADGSPSKNASAPDTEDEDDDKLQETESTDQLWEDI